MEIENVMVELKEPAQCHLWTAKNIQATKPDFEHIETYINESHLVRSLYRCRECDQLYYHEFYEVINWEGGHDPQYTTFIPVPPDEKLIEGLNNRNSFELLGVFPRLQQDNNAPIRWVGKKGDQNAEG